MCLLIINQVWLLYQYYGRIKATVHREIHTICIQKQSLRNQLAGLL